jgi:hypothetical protein
MIMLTRCQVENHLERPSTMHNGTVQTWIDRVGFLLGLSCWISDGHLTGGESRPRILLPYSR